MDSNDSTPDGTINLQIQLDEETAQGRYANLVMMNHTDTEFVFDFIFVQPQQPQAKVLSRIICSPKHAKNVLTALKENVAVYEQRFGKIKTETTGNDETMH